MSQVQTVEALEAICGAMPPAMALKVIDHLDAGARQWIAASPLAIMSFDARATLVSPVFAATAGQLVIRSDMLDDAAMASVGSAVGALFLAPGVRETLRVNGRVARITADEVHVSVGECYGHCAKAFIRSDFWSAAPVAAPATDAAAFVARSRFMGLATLGANDHADLSPKGDPAAHLAHLDGNTLWFADRPGNRRLDSFRNIIERACVGIILIEPGRHEVAIVTGRAALTTDEAIRQRFAVDGKVPKLAVRVAVEDLVLRASPALQRAALWPLKAPDEPIDAAGLFLAHVRLNRDAGLRGRIAAAALSIPGMPGLMRKGLDKDYRDNLY